MGEGASFTKSDDGKYLCNMKRSHKIIVGTSIVVMICLFTLGYLAETWVRNYKCPLYELVGAEFQVLEILETQSDTLEAASVDTLHIGGCYGFVLDLDFLNLNPVEYDPIGLCFGPPSVVRDSVLKIEVEALAEDQELAIRGFFSCLRSRGSFEVGRKQLRRGWGFGFFYPATE